MKFKRHSKLESNLHAIHIAPLISVIFLTLIFFILTSSLTSQSGIKVKLPRAITSDVIKEESLSITVTGENIIYLDHTVSTVDDLRNALKKSSNKNRPILIKSDRRASLGRVIDIWDLCREMGVERINIATDRKE